MYSHGCLFGWMLQCQNPTITPLFVPHKVPLNKVEFTISPFAIFLKMEKRLLNLEWFLLSLEINFFKKKTKIFRIDFHKYFEVKLRPFLS